MTESVLESSKKRSGIKTADFLKTPEKDNCEKLTYSETPLSSDSRRRSLVILSENNQKFPASENAKNPSSDSAESRFNSALEKVRVSLFHKKEKKIETKSKLFSLNSTLFYGASNKERYLPLAPDILGMMNQKPGKNKLSHSQYDFPDKKVARKRKSGVINRGVSHGIKKLKCRVQSIKKELSETGEHIVIDKQDGISQKENVEEAERSQNTIEDYNPNKKFFKHKRPDKLKISVGSKPRQKKNMKQKETEVSYSNIFGSSKSKKQFYEHLNTRHTAHSDSKTLSTFQHSPDIVKKESFDQHYQYQQDPQNLIHEVKDAIGDHLNNSEECSNLETKNEVDEGTDDELPYLNIPMDIENNNFSNNEMMTDVAIHSTEELESQTTVGNTLFFMESLVPDVSYGQNHLAEHSSGNAPLNCSSYSKQYQINVEQSDIRNVQCQECNFVYKIENENEVLAHLDYHSDYCDLKFQGWKKDHGVDISTDSESKVVIIKPFDPESHRKKGFDILKVINKELGLSNDELIDNNKKFFFIYVKEKLIVGVVVAEYLELAYRLVSDSSAPSRIFSETIPAKCGVKAIWASQNHRRQGIATTLMDSLRNHFFDNYQMKLDDLAVSIPTASGRLFAEKYMGTCDLKVF